MKGRWKALLTLGGLAATALVFKTFEGDPESRRKRRARKEDKGKGDSQGEDGKRKKKSRES